MADPTRVLVLGSGFAGLWTALAATQRLDELGVAPGTVDVTRPVLALGSQVVKPDIHASVM